MQFSCLLALQLSQLLVLICPIDWLPSVKKREDKEEKKKKVRMSEVLKQDQITQNKMSAIGNKLGNTRKEPVNMQHLAQSTAVHTAS